jgi:hypothetical protein
VIEGPKLWGIGTENRQAADGAVVIAVRVPDAVTYSPVSSVTFKATLESQLRTICEPMPVGFSSQLQRCWR